MSLLPKNTTKLERALEQTVTTYDHSQQVPVLWNASSCPRSVLPWLAWAVSVDDWDTSWGEEKKRKAIEESLEIHEHKGTLSAIRLALSIRGQGDAEIIERADYIRHNGEAIRNGYRRRGGPSQWATFRVILKRPITIDQSGSILAMINSVKRNCCHLIDLNFSAVAIRHNGFAKRDGQYVRGIITI